MTNLEEVKERLGWGYELVNDGCGWVLRTPKSCARTFRHEIPDSLVALLTAQGFIKTELRLVGSAQWVGA